MFLCLYVCLYVSMSLCMSQCLYVSMSLCMSLCLYVCLYASMSLCLYVSISFSEEKKLLSNKANIADFKGNTMFVLYLPGAWKYNHTKINMFHIFSCFRLVIFVKQWDKITYYHFSGIDCLQRRIWGGGNAFHLSTKSPRAELGRERPPLSSMLCG